LRKEISRKSQKISIFKKFNQKKSAICCLDQGPGAWASPAARSAASHGIKSDSERRFPWESVGSLVVVGAAG
jgi:hypothetical protein